MKSFKYLLLVLLLNCAGETYECANGGCTYDLSNKPKTPETPSTTTVINNNNTTIVVENITNITNINIIINEFVSNYNFYIYIDGRLYVLNTDDAVVTIINGEITLTWNLDKDCDKEHEKKEHKKKPKIKKISGNDKVIHQGSHGDRE